MNLTRRHALKLGGASLVAISVLPANFSFAQNSEAQKYIDEFTMGAEIKEGGVEIEAPKLAENGGSVPITITAEGAKSIMLIAEENPIPRVVTFNFGELSGNSQISTKIRMAKSQNLMAIAKMGDGTFKSVSVAVEVSVGGC